jgi:CheY-like chemotaxis protein
VTPDGATTGILLVEDDPDDVLLVRRALDVAGPGIPLHVVSDGDAAIAYFEARRPSGAGECRALPCFVLLDLKLPRRSGLEVLEWLRAQPVLRRVPVVVLTSSGQQHDVDRAYDVGVNSYLVKPVRSQAFVEMLRHMVRYWTQLNHPPGLHASAEPRGAGPAAARPREPARNSAGPAGPPPSA